MKQLVLTLAILLSSSSIFFCKTLEEIREEAHYDILRTLLEEVIATNIDPQDGIQAYFSFLAKQPVKNQLIKKVKLLIQGEENPEYKKQLLLLFSLLKTSNNNGGPGINTILEKGTYNAVLNIKFMCYQMYNNLMLMSKLGAFIIFKKMVIEKIDIKSVTIISETFLNLLYMSIGFYIIADAVCNQFQLGTSSHNYYTSKPEFKVLQKLYKEEKEKQEEHIKNFRREELGLKVD